MLKFTFIFLFFLTTLNHAFAENACRIQLKSSVIMNLKKSGAMIATATQQDYGHKYTSSSCYLEATPKNIEQVMRLVKIAYENNIKIRTQGAGHSQNGSSLPKWSELLIHTNQLNKITFNQPGFVTVESGIPIALVNKAVQENSNYAIPIYNGGGVGPTVGGYIAAGGISPASEQYGGFWEHVKSITVIIQNGQQLKIPSHSPLFLWQFGAMGQLGIIVQAELNLIAVPTIAPHYPLGKTLNINYEKNGGIYWHQTKQPTLHWFNLFLSATQESEAINELNALQSKYSNALNYYPIYRWEVRYLTKMPPLLFDEKSNFYAVGVWGVEQNLKELQQLENDFKKLVLLKGYKRYIQAEFENSTDFYKNYFHKKTYAQFKVMKQKFDPKFLFNSNSFFEQNEHHD